MSKIEQPAGPAATKVPEVNTGFWAIKIVATTLGEVGGNVVTLTLGLGYLAGTAIFASALVVLLAAPFRAPRFHPLLYWAVITATTLAGTTLADFCDRSLGIGYLGGSLLLLAAVVATLLLWKHTLGTVAVETVRSPRAEGFYWATIMFSQTLGTALGDWMADSTGLGYNGSALLILVALTGTAALYWRTRISRPLLFWTAFVLTRPLGATLANSFDKPPASGGLGISDITITAALAVLMVACVLAIPQRAGGHPGSANAA
ncbi:hypothetical protein ACLBXJ_03905 [Methylobacterium mesophilicum]